jgi:hypothetical protein
VSNLLLDERPVALLPSLVRAVGITDAAVLQQLHYWLQRASKSHDGHAWVYKTYGEWAQEIGVTAKAARGALERLRESGAVVSMQNPMDARDRTLWWRIDHDRLPGRPSAPGGRPDAPGGSSRAGVPDVVSESTDREEGVRASTAVDKDTQPVVVFDRKRVPPSRLQLAEQLLDEFNTEANTTYAAYTGDGKPSEALKRILGALTEHPDIDGAVWSQGLRVQFVEPWWTSTPAPGVIFGRSQREKTLELARSGREAVVRAESPRDRQLRERQERADRDGPALKAVLEAMGIGDANRAAKQHRDAQRQLEEGS